MERRGYWLKDIIALGALSGVSLPGAALFLWSILSSYFAGMGPPYSDPIPYWLAFFTIALGGVLALLGFLSRQRGVIDEIQVAPPWYLFVQLRRVRRIPFMMVREVKVENSGPLGRAVLTLANGRRLRIDLADFEDPTKASRIIETAASKLKPAQR